LAEEAQLKKRSDRYTITKVCFPLEAFRKAGMPEELKVFVVAQNASMAAYDALRALGGESVKARAADDPRRALASATTEELQAHLLTKSAEERAEFFTQIMAADGSIEALQKHLDKKVAEGKERKTAKKH
jgi:hypothetical protein